MRRRDVEQLDSGHENAQSETVRDSHRAKQPYASELDDRELEHAHKEKRPVSPSSAPDPSKADKTD